MLRKKIVRLSKMFNGKLSSRLPVTGDSFEYRILDVLLTDNLADVALAAGLRKDRDAIALSRRSGYPVRHVEKMADSLAEIGIFSSWVENGVRKYRADSFFPITMMNVLTGSAVMAAHPEVGAFFDGYVKRAYGALDGGSNPEAECFGVIPVYKSVPASRFGTGDPQSVSFHISKAVRFCLSSCACAIARSACGSGDGSDPEGKCLHLDRRAEYFIDTQRGKEITRGEAQSFIQKASAAALLHILPDLEPDGRALSVCACSFSTCLGLRGAAESDSFSAISSDFAAKRNDTKCISCTQCVKHCPTSAIKMSSRYPLFSVQASPSAHQDGLSALAGTERIRAFRETDSSLAAPCFAACPLNMPIQAFLGLVKREELFQGLSLMRKSNPFPSITSRLCVCEAEKGCLRAKIDDPVAIKDVERFLSDAAEEFDIGTEDCHRFAGGLYEDKVAIIGSGPAGMSCAYYLARMGYRPVVFEKESVPGGALSHLVPPYKMDKAVVEKEISRLEQMGVEFHCSVRIGSDLTVEQLKRLGFKAFLLAIGVDSKVSVGAGGGICAGTDYLHRLNQDRIDNFEEPIVVVGDNPVAFSVARGIVRKSGNAALVYSKRARGEMGIALDELVDAESEGVKAYNGWQIFQTLNTAGHVSAAVFKKASGDDERREGEDASSRDGEEDTRTVECATLVFCQDVVANWGGLDSQFGIKIADGDGIVLTDSDTFATSVPGVFAAGSVASRKFSVASAIRDGREAAESIHRFLHKGQSLVAGRRIANYIPIDKDLVSLRGDDIGHSQRVSCEYGKIEVNHRSFSVSRLAYTQAQAQQEAGRCMNCASVTYDEGKCIGCGQCSVKCPVGAFAMRRLSGSSAHAKKD